jgi:hypothetical protein
LRNKGGALPLQPQEKDALVQQLAILVEMNEPDAALATLKRIAERRAHAATRPPSVDVQEAVRWLDLAEALGRVQRERIHPPGN